MLNYQVISLFTVAIINALFAFFIIGKGEEKNNTSATLFSLITVAISMWALNIAFFIQYQYADSARIFLNVYYVSAAFIPVLFLYFSMTFFGGKKIRPLIGLTAIPLLAFILFLFYQPIFSLLLFFLKAETYNLIGIRILGIQFILSFLFFGRTACWYTS